MTGKSLLKSSEAARNILVSEDETCKVHVLEACSCAINPCYNYQRIIMTCGTLVSS